MPYTFEFFDAPDKARDRYESVESWMPKFYFRPKVKTSGEDSAEYWCIAYRNEPVTPFAIDRITDVVDPTTMLLMESGLSSEIEAPVAILECGGQRLEQIEPIPGFRERLSIPLSCSHYCRRIRTTSFLNTSGNRLCIDFDMSVLERIQEGKEPDNLIAKRTFEFQGVKTETFAYICWAGLVDCVSTIVVDNKLLAVAFTGQLQLRSPDGETYLRDGRRNVCEKLAIDAAELEGCLETDRTSGLVTTVDETLNVHLSNIARVGCAIARLVTNEYVSKRQEREQYFLSEIDDIFHRKGSHYDLESIGAVLERIRCFMGFEEVYFLLNNVAHPSYHEIVGKASGLLNDAEEDFFLSIGAQELQPPSQVVVFELNKTGRYGNVLTDIVEQVPGLNVERLWIGSCPLPGADNALWLFVPPSTTGSARSPGIISDLDKRTLRRFCASVRDTIGTMFASSMVMRKIGHELGASIQSVISRERAIIDRIKDADVTRKAKRNLLEMHKYHCLVDNLRNLYIRRGHEEYEFRKHGLTRPVMDVYEACLYDDEVLRRGIILREPVLKGNRTILMHLPSMTMAIFNLIQNAIKYSFDNHYIEILGSEVNFECKPGRKTYCLSVTNFGVGITPGEISSGIIFKELYRGVLSRDRNRSGTGLGLAIAKRVVEDHNGSITCSSISAVEIGHLRKHGRSLPEEARGILLDGEDDLKFGYLTTFKVNLPVGA